jgi:hypothetical protein
MTDGAVYIPSALSDLSDGNTHNHSGGKGGQIDYNGLANKPTIPPDLSGAVTSLQNTLLAGVKVIRSGDNVYIRTKWNATSDLVQSLKLAIATPDTQNSAVNGIAIGLIPIATLDAAVPTTPFSTTFKTTDDDMSPVNMNGTYIGGNHGAFVGKLVTATAHGKTVQDVGSEWLDGSNHKFYIIKIVDCKSIQGVQ